MLKYKDALNAREIHFNKFTKAIPFPGRKISPGLYVVDIPEHYYQNIATTTRQFISKVITKKTILLSDEKIVELLKSDEFSNIDCLTPSGMILPKIYSSLEYNHLMKSFYDLINELKIDVEFWYSIMPLRYKAAYKENYKPGIQYSHEPHLDSWTGFSNYAYCAFLPILGDLENNFIEFWEPTNGINESWISGFKATNERCEILQNFTRIDFKLRSGQLALADSYVVHNTKINKNAGPRIGIDNLFRPSWSSDLSHVEDNNRNSDLRTHQELSNIGIETYYDFIDNDATRRPSKGGLKSPVGFNFIGLKNK